MAKKRKLQAKPAPVPEPEPEPEPESEPEEEAEEEDDPAEEEPEEEEEEEEDPAEEELEEEEEEGDLAEEESEEEGDDDGEEDSSHSNDEYPNRNGSTAVHNANPNGPTPVDPTSVRDLLAPLSKDQLISLLTSTAVSHPSVLKEIQSTAEDSSQRNIFVDGLSSDITDVASLYAVFSKYGAIEDVHIVTDKITGKSRGYAFVLFQTLAAAQNALKEPQKKIGKRLTSCKLASFGPPSTVVSAASSAVVSAASTAVVQNALQPPLSSRKIYVGNVSSEIDPGRILKFFQQFGEVEEGPLGLDEATGKPKGFVLFVYKTDEGAKRVLEQPQKHYRGYLLHCSRASNGPIGKVQMTQQNNNFVGGTASPAMAPPSHHMAAEEAQRLPEQPHESYGGHLMHCSRASNGPIGKVQMAQQSNNFVGGSASPAVAPPAHHMAARAVPTVGVGYNQPVGPQVLPMQTTNAALGFVGGSASPAVAPPAHHMAAEGGERALEQPHKSYGGHLMHCSRASNGPIGTVQMAQQSNNFVGGADSPAVAPPAHHMTARTSPTVGVGYNQPVDPQVPPVQTINAALGQAVGQALTALGFGNLLGGLGGGVQAPAVANSAVPPVQGGYTAGLPVHGGYAAGAPMQSGYAAVGPVPGGYATRAPVPEGFAARAPMQGGYVARTPMQGGYAAGAPMQGGYAARAPVQGGYAAGAPVQGEYAAGAAVLGGYANQGIGQGGDISRYPQGGVGGYGNHASYR